MSSLAAFDAIVIGTGGVGSAALFHLARRGARVLGIDQFAAGHRRGSSHGQTRIIRSAYFEHPDYVPLCLAATRMWRELEQRLGIRLFRETGLLEVGPADGTVIPGVLSAARRHELRVVQLGRAAAGKKYPPLAIPAHQVAVFEPQAGYLLVERCVLSHLVAARHAGARLETGAQVEQWRVDGPSVVVQTSRGDFAADRLVVTAGPWAAGLLPSLGNVGHPLTVVRKHLYWFPTEDHRYEADGGFPIFFFETPAGYFYGFPALDQKGVKVCRHSGGEAIDGDPSLISRSVDSADLQLVQDFVRTCLPGVHDQHCAHDVCLYTMSPDEHFVVGLHPEYNQVALAAGLSGHGFKFAPVLGAALADLALDGHTSHPIEFLRPGR